MTNNEYIRWLKLLEEELTFDALIDGKDEMDMHEMIWNLCEKLEQEPKTDGDCISRQAVLEITAETGALETQARVKALPPVNPQEPKTEWIPCSERLPEEGRYVLCSQSNGDVGEGKLLQDSCGEWLILYDNLIVDDGKVIAWMPLPEPYKESED